VPQIRDRVAINTSRVEESGGGDCAGSPIIDRTRLGASAMASAVATSGGGGGGGGGGMNDRWHQRPARTRGPRYGEIRGRGHQRAGVHGIRR
jgi:hypothetical protein